jgi:YVTN family beta-propeller protein
MKNLFKLVFLLPLLASCMKNTDYSNMTYSFGGGVFIVNEGNFLSGNGSLSLYSYDSLKIYNDLFYSANGRALGDVPNSAVIKGDKLYIVVNNSGKIEVVNKSTISSQATITGLTSPRNMLMINDYKAYVSSLYSDSVAIVKLADNSIAGYINIRRTSESMVMIGNYAYIANWSGGKEVMVVNTVNDKVVDSIEVGNEPESMVCDKYGNLWVLCNGGWKRDNYAELIEIYPSSNTVKKTLTFSTKTESPTSLRINGTGDILYFLDSGVRKMDISATGLPSAPFIVQESGQSFYNIGINYINNDIFVCDAVDYTQNGYVLLYTGDGEYISKCQTGITPGAICFNLSIITTSK